MNWYDAADDDTQPFTADDFDPETLDHFEAVEVKLCGATSGFAMLAEADDLWSATAIECTEEAGHDGEHVFTFSWADTTVEIDCTICGDTGLTTAFQDASNGGLTPISVPCNCQAGQPYRDSQEESSNG